jgi:hypothetical protein
MNTFCLSPKRLYSIEGQEKPNTLHSTWNSRTPIAVMMANCEQTQREAASLGLPVIFICQILNILSSFPRNTGYELGVLSLGKGSEQCEIKASSCGKPLYEQVERKAHASTHSSDEQPPACSNEFKGVHWSQYTTVTGCGIISASFQDPSKQAVSISVRCSRADVPNKGGPHSQKTIANRFIRRDSEMGGALLSFPGHPGSRGCFYNCRKWQLTVLAYLTQTLAAKNPTFSAHRNTAYAKH